MTDKRIVLTTTGSKEEAQKIASSLVERHLAACVNVVGPISSTYRWQGKVDAAEEFLLIIKTTADAYQSLAAAIRQLHSYELPEILQVEITDGLPEYLAWIAESLKIK
ncbi:MAG: divalent-cation tolerance protein CutA [Acidobacteria bacterium]|nr:divalent-cation tolerance protein CutA [Acidobacteriaceae bacterium]MBV9610655.1 divalent-cation tolerance protein CutA [Acidobacteriota bacterium]